MIRFLPRILDTKHESILSQERSLAKAVASAVIEEKPVTVWEITIPILFLVNFLKFKRSREIFALNFLFTKKLALEAAFSMVEKGLSREEAMDRVKRKTMDILTSDQKGIYSQKIRQKQLKEIELLIDHYRRLLEVDGKDYPSMLKNAYQTCENYTAFLNRLKLVENEVNRAAQQTVRVATAVDLVSKMEKVTEKIRAVRAERIFGMSS